MRRLIVTTFMTLDGVMQAPGGPPEDPSGGFTWGGWSVNYWDDLMGQVMGDAMAEPSELLLGRKTYEIFAAHWPFSSEEPAASMLNQAKKYVASRTLDRVTWNNSVLLKGEIVPQIKQLKQQEGPELLVQGSSNLIQTLLENNLVDEYRLWIFPLVIGAGKRLFGSGTLPNSLKLLSTRVSGTGVIIATYQPAGELSLGTFELAEPSEAELARRRKVAQEG